MKVLEALLGLHAPWQFELLVRFAGASLVVLGTAAMISYLLKARPEARNRVLAASLLAAILVPISASFVAVVQPPIPSPSAMARIDNPVPLAPGPRVELLRWIAGPEAEIAIERADAGGPSYPGPGFFAFVFLGWAMGTTLLAGRLALGLRRLARRARGASVVTDGRIRRMLEEMDAPKNLRVVRSGAFGSPAVFGWRRPVLVVTDAMASWSERRLRTCLLHEMAHLRRRDWLVGLLAQVGRAVLWFNPLAWWIARELQASAELACDREVLRTGVRGMDYARDLVTAARECCCPARATVPDLPFAGRTGLERRVSEVIHFDSRRKSTRTIGLAVALLILVSSAAALVRPELAGCAESPNSHVSYC